MFHVESESFMWNFMAVAGLTWNLMIISSPRFQMSPLCFIFNKTIVSEDCELNLWRDWLLAAMIWKSWERRNFLINGRLAFWDHLRCNFLKDDDSLIASVRTRQFMRLTCLFRVRSRKGFGSSVIERIVVNMNSKLTFLLALVSAHPFPLWDT